MECKELGWKSTKELISYSEEEKNLTESEKDNLIIELTKRLKRETQPSEDKTYGEFFYDKFSDFINNMCCDSDGFVKQALKDHNTLQQSAFRLFLKLTKGYSELPNWKVDGRNEYTNKTAKQIMELLDNNTNCPFI